MCTAVHLSAVFWCDNVMKDLALQFLIKMNNISLVKMIIVLILSEREGIVSVLPTVN